MCNLLLLDNNSDFKLELGIFALNKGEIGKISTKIIGSDLPGNKKEAMDYSYLSGTSLHSLLLTGLFNKVIIAQYIHSSSNL